MTEEGTLHDTTITATLDLNVALGQGHQTAETNVQSAGTIIIEMIVQPEICDDLTKNLILALDMTTPDFRVVRVLTGRMNLVTMISRSDSGTVLKVHPRATLTRTMVDHLRMLR